MKYLNIIRNISIGWLIVGVVLVNADTISYWIAGKSLDIFDEKYSISTELVLFPALVLFLVTTYLLKLKTKNENS